jgi:hypothetical protein
MMGPEATQAALDQIEAGIRDMARFTRVYFDRMKEAGFDEDHAIALTMTMTREFYRSAWSRQS